MSRQRNRVGCIQTDAVGSDQWIGLRLSAISNEERTLLMARYPPRCSEVVWGMPVRTAPHFTPLRQTHPQKRQIVTFAIV